MRSIPRTSIDIINFTSKIIKKQQQRIVDDGRLRRLITIFCLNEIHFPPKHNMTSPKYLAKRYFFKQVEYSGFLIVAQSTVDSSQSNEI
jgi:hypothetical protein